jgi:hypothetical protein
MCGTESTELHYHAAMLWNQAAILYGLVVAALAPCRARIALAGTAIPLVGYLIMQVSSDQSLWLCGHSIMSIATPLVLVYALRTMRVERSKRTAVLAGCFALIEGAMLAYICWSASVLSTLRALAAD